jgi:hypothetical protein
MLLSCITVNALRGAQHCCGPSFHAETEHNPGKCPGLHAGPSREGFVTDTSELDGTNTRLLQYKE